MTTTPFSKRYCLTVKLKMDIIKMLENFTIPSLLNNHDILVPEFTKIQVFIKPFASTLAEPSSSHYFFKKGAMLP